MQRRQPHHAGNALAHRHRTQHILHRLGHHHTRQARQGHAAQAFPHGSAGQRPGPGQRWHEECGPHPRHAEQPPLQQPQQLPARPGPALAEGRMVEERPGAETIGHHDDQFSIIAQHPPAFAQQGLGRLHHLQRMHQHDAIHGKVGQRQQRLGHHRGRGWGRGAGDGCRHQGEAARRLA